MIKAIKRFIIRNELKKLNAKSEQQFIDMVCNKYNKGVSFWKIK